MSHNSFQPQPSQHHAGDVEHVFGPQNTNNQPLPTSIAPDFLDAPIKSAIEILFKQQKNTKSLVTRKELTLTKLQQHVIAGTVPSDLNFRYGGYSQYPNTVPPTTKQEAITTEIALYNDFIRKALEVRIKVIGDDLTTTRSSLYSEDQHWIEALHKQLPVLRSDPRLLNRANNLLLAALVTRQLEESTRTARSEPVPAPAPATNMAVDATTDTMDSLTKAVAALQAQMKSLSHNPKRSKNVSGSGSASTEPRRNRAAQGRSDSQRTRSNSRTRPTTDHRKNPRSRSQSRAPSRREERAAPRHTPSRRHSGTPQKQRRTQNSRNKGRSPSRNSRSPDRKRDDGRRRAPSEPRYKRN